MGPRSEVERNRHDGPVIVEAQDALTIGEVINLLKDDFPDISVSKVRFLESQGLLAPGRSDGGYRQFDHHDIDRLRFILGQQRDHFLPLKVIKSKLTLWERGEDVGPGVAVDEDRLLQSGSESMTRDELVRRSSLSPEQLDALIDHSLIHIDASGGFSTEALVVATEARRLFSHGLEARHLRTILHAVEREADVLGQLTAPLRRARNAEAHEQARNILAGAGEAMLSVHRALLTEELKRLADS